MPNKTRLNTIVKQMDKKIETNPRNIFKNTSLKKKSLGKEKQRTLQKISIESLQLSSFWDTLNNNNKHHHWQIQN